MDSPLCPETAIKDNFEIYNEGAKLEIAEAIYMPTASQMLFRLAEPYELTSTDCTIKMQNLTYMDESLEAPSQGLGIILHESGCDMYDVSVQRQTILQNGVQVLHPVADVATEVKVKVVNTSASQKTRSVVLYIIDGENQTELGKYENMTFKPRSAADIIFDLPNGIAAGTQGTICAFVL